VECLDHLETLLACGNPAVTSLNPLLKLRLLKELWLTRCGVVEVELASLIEEQQILLKEIPRKKHHQKQQVDKRAGGGGGGEGVGNSSTKPSDSNRSSRHTGSSNVTGLLGNGGGVGGGFRSSLRVLTVRGCPLAAHHAAKPLLIAHFPGLAFLDGQAITPVKGKQVSMLF
jgi:hypothetical protein